jgi:hypothetical protein
MREDRERERVWEKRRKLWGGGDLVGDSTFIAGKGNTFMALRFPRQGESLGSEAGKVINIGTYAVCRGKK